MKQKSISIAFNTIVAALIALAIFAFVMLVFSKYLGKGVSGYDQQISSVSDTASSSTLYQKCYTYVLTCSNKEAFSDEKECGQFEDLVKMFNDKCKS